MAARRDEERQLNNLRRRQARDRAKLEHDDAYLPQPDDDGWDVGEDSVRRRLPAPEELGDVLGGIVAAKGWQDRVVGATVLRRWGEIVGEAIAAHTRPVRLAGGILVVAASDNTWVTQVRYLTDQIAERINAHLPEDQAVQQVDVVLDRAR